MPEEVLEMEETQTESTQEVETVVESDFIESFKQIIVLGEQALQEARNLETNKVKKSATRCRNALNEIKKLSLDLRKETITIRDNI